MIIYTYICVYIYIDICLCATLCVAFCVGHFVKSWPGDAGDAPVVSQAGPMFAINSPIESDKEGGADGF